MDDLGSTIRKLREQHQLLLITVATDLKIDQSILSKIESGQKMATSEQILKLI